MKTHIPTIAFLFALVAATPAPAANEYDARFQELYKKIHDPAAGYFSPQGIPYHSPETLICEAPDYGHETTSETLSYYVWLEAMSARITGDYSGVKKAWDIAEKFGIPAQADQKGLDKYTANKPAAYAGEWERPEKYPSPLDPGIPAGADPIHQELTSAYPNASIYGMHWLIDTDNWYGYGQRGDGTSKPSFINTFQRGPHESVWQTVPHPCYESFKWGGKNGFLDLFIRDNNYARQWRYTDAPDADARMIQAAFWAKRWADAAKADVGDVPARAAKMGDFLRYAMFDKYFKPLGCESLQAQGARSYESCHYLLSWYYAWGGTLDGGWAWKIGCSHAHFGYQNPLAAWALATSPDFAAKSPNAPRDWAQGLKRQVEFYQWLQSSEGAIAGGATNSVNGRYDRHPANTPTFYGMVYQEHPVYSDPGSNSWFGWQTWSVERLAEYYYLTGDKNAAAVLAKWVKWASSSVKLEGPDGYAIPATLTWSGQPETYRNSPPANAALHVTVADTNSDVGIASSLARTLMYYAAGTKAHGTYDDAPRALAKELLDRMWRTQRDDKGLSIPEPRSDYKRIFEQEVYIPAGWSGAMPNGDKIAPGVKFIDIRSQYKKDPAWPLVEKAYKEGKPPVFRYHRFWAQVEAALAAGTYAELFPDAK